MPGTPDGPAAPLAGLRVLEVATGVAGPYAGRLLAMSGATVVKVEPAGGDPARTLPVDGGPIAEPGPAYVHLNAGKRSVSAAAAPPAEALGWADVVLSDRVRSRFGPWEDVDAVADPPLLVSVTAWGLDADDAGEPADEMLVQAASGLLAATRLEDEPPWRFPGWQSQYLAGTYAAAGALAGLGRARHVEVSWVGAACSAVEAQAAATLSAMTSPHPDDPEEERRQSGFQARTFPSGVFACADGFVVPGTVRGKDWPLQCDLYDRPDLVHDPRFSWGTRWAHREELRAELGGWYGARSRREIFDLALHAGWSVGMVLTATDALTDRHLAHRGFLGTVTGDASATAVVRPWLTEGRAAPPSVHLSAPAQDDGWFDARRARSRVPAMPAARGLRVVELTWAWAGPFVGRFLAALGADVVRVEAGAHPDGWRTRFRFADIGATPGPGQRPEDHTWDAAAQFNSVNRGKRAVSADLSHPDGAAVFRDLVAAADVLVVNMNHRVLTGHGLDGFVAERVEDGLVFVTMPALGADGPDRAMPGFGMLTEAMGGFAARHGDPAAGARTSPTYYPDAVSGAHGTVAVLAGLVGRARDGRGCAVDLSQQETLWMQFGEGVVLASREGRDPARTGNTEPGRPGSGLLATGDGHVAVTGAPAGARRVDDVRTLFGDGRLEAMGMVEWADHPVTGPRAHLGIPVRLDDAPLRPGRPAPMFDQHTDEVVAQWLGTDPDALARLRAAGALGTRPGMPRSRPDRPARAPHAARS